MPDPVGYVVAGRCADDEKWYLDSMVVWDGRREAEADRADAQVRAERNGDGERFIVCAVIPVEGEGDG